MNNPIAALMIRDTVESSGGGSKGLAHLPGLARVHMILSLLRKRMVISAFGVCGTSVLPRGIAMGFVIISARRFHRTSHRPDIRSTHPATS